MTTQEITLNLPESIYDQIRQAAEKVKRPMHDVLVEALSAAAPAITFPPDEMQATLANMAFLNDAALWRAARSTMIPEQRRRLETLHDLQQQHDLPPKERTEEQALLKLYRETILVRAQAAVILKQRGYDVSDPSQFAPLR